MTRSNVGTLVRHWRSHRARSQLDLALDVGVSTRHLSYVETGRSRPSPELIEAIGIHLDVPLRDRNAMLLAAGFAPAHRRTPLDDPGLTHVLDQLGRLLRAHEPHPGFVLDRQWNVVLANTAADAMQALLPGELVEPTVNIFRASLHPAGFASFTRNFDEWATSLLAQLDRLIVLTDDADLKAIRDEVDAYPNVADLRRRSSWQAPFGSADRDDVLIPCELVVGGTELSMFSTHTSFGTPRDITLEELSIELFFPTDAVTAEFFRSAMSHDPSDPTSLKEPTDD